MLNFVGSHLRSDFLLKFGSGFYEEEEGEEWVTVSYIILLIFILFYFIKLKF